MKSRRSLALPAVLAVLLLGLWLCSSQLGGANLGLLGGGDVQASEEVDSSLAGLVPGLGAEADTGDSHREEVAVVAPVDAGLSAEAEAAVPEYKTRMHGRVVRMGGAPVAGATVVVRQTQPWFTAPADVEDMQAMEQPGPRFEATTDEEGSFVLYDVPAGRLSLSIRGDGLAPLSRDSLQVPEYEDYDMGRFQMEPGIRLAGKVVGARGKGLAGVTILCAVTKEAGYARLELPGYGIPLTESDVDGEFEITGLAPGSWQLIFDAPGYRVTELQGVTEPAGQRERGLLVSMELGLSIKGKVVGLDPIGDGPLRVTARRADEQPSGAADNIKGAERYRARHSSVGADGSFDVAGLAPGVKYRLRLYYENESKPDESTGRTTLRWRIKRGVDDIDEMAGAANVEFKYRDEGVVLLQVKNAKTAGALSRFSVYISGERLGGSGALKGADDEVQLQFPGGAVRYEGLRPAELGSTLTVRVRADGFEDFEKKGLMLRPGQELDVGEVELVPAPIGLVKVLDKESGEAIEGARVLYSKGGDSKELARWLRYPNFQDANSPKVRQALTDKQGIARLTMWDGQVAVVQATADGYQAGQEMRHSSPYEELVEFELVRGAQVIVSVQDAQGHPVAGMFVEHSIDGKRQNNNFYWSNDGGLKNKTGDSGVVRFENLPMGKHSFRALEKQNPWGQSGESTSYEAEGHLFLADGESGELTLRVAARGGLKATILESGLPLAGALVKIKEVDSKSTANFWWGGSGAQDPRTKVSNHAGRVEFSAIKVGRYLLRVSHPERRMVIAREVLISVEADDLRVELGVATIEGRVVDPAGDSIQGVSITVGPRNNKNYDGDMNDYRVRITEDEDGDADWEMEQTKQWSIRTGDDGRFVLRGVTPEQLLIVGASNRYVVRGSKKVGPLGTDEYYGPFDMVLERAGALRVELTGVDRRERGKYTVRLLRMVDGKQKEKRDHRMRSWRSNLTVDSLRPGQWRVVLLHKDMQGALLERDFEIQIGQTTRLDLRP